jgi:hypothetical protein
MERDHKVFGQCARTSPVTFGSTSSIFYNNIPVCGGLTTACPLTR